MDKNQIFITSGTEYKKMTKELLEKADLQSHIGDRKKKIGIKPNLVSPSEASWGADYASGWWFRELLSI